MDVARDQLGAGKLFTSHHTNSSGHITRTRIDQMYAPHAANMIWNHSTNHTFLPQRPHLTGPPDHIGLELTLELAKGDPVAKTYRASPQKYTWTPLPINSLMSA